MSQVTLDLEAASLQTAGTFHSPGTLPGPLSWAQPGWSACPTDHGWAWPIPCRLMPHSQLCPSASAQHGQMWRLQCASFSKKACATPNPQSLNSHDASPLIHNFQPFQLGLLFSHSNAATICRAGWWEDIILASFNVMWQPTLLQLPWQCIGAARKQQYPECNEAATLGGGRGPSHPVSTTK